jgi:hypothetical protein
VKLVYRQKDSFKTFQSLESMIIRCRDVEAASRAVATDERAARSHGKLKMLDVLADRQQTKCPLLDTPV